MRRFEFVTVDVFARRPFEGNQLAVVLDAEGLSDDQMLAIAREFRFSETVFVLPPERGGDARARIFTLDSEAGFAGHPLVGLGTVLAERRGAERLAIEVPAGICEVRIEGGRAVVDTPVPLLVEAEVPAELVAGALGVPADGVVCGAHGPTIAGMGRDFVIAEVTADALVAAGPDPAAFARVRAAIGRERFAVLAYARGGGEDGSATDRDADGAPEDASAEPRGVECRMFSPLTGTVEDAATGSANVALTGLLLSLDAAADELAMVSRQGVHTGRPSELHLRAWREGDAIRASVGGDVVVVTEGTLRV